MRCVGIIMARMGSSRLPGKALRPLVGEPVLWHIIHRLRQCRSLEAVAVATSTNPVDDPLEAFAVGEGIEVVRGPEENVLARFALAAERLDADIIARVLGDCPLVDPATIDTMVEKLIETDADYCRFLPQEPCIHEGMFPFTRRSLQKLVREAADDPLAQHYISAYFLKNPDFARACDLPVEPECQFSWPGISVDTPADFRFLEEVYARLKVPVGEADVRQVVRLLRTEPDLCEINAHVHRKGLEEPTRLALFRCDGDEQIGLGHLFRCLAVAEELREGHGWGAVFATASGSLAAELISKAGFPVEQKQGGQEDAWLGSVIERLRPDALVLDVRSGLGRSSLERWRGEGLLIATIDDPSERRLSADLAFYPPVPQVHRLDWTGFQGRLFVGWDWVVLRREFSKARRWQTGEQTRLLVTMGGSDPAGLTLQAVEAIDTLDGGFETVLVLGPGFSHHEELRSLLAKARRSYEVRRGVADMASLVAQADLAVASFGVTAYELAAVGVPAVLLCLSDDHAESAAGFDAEGIGLSLGVHAKVTKPMLAEAVEGMLLDASRRSVMALRAKQRVDGRGAERIAAVIARGECSMQSETPYIINGYVVRPEIELEGSRCGYLANDKF